MDIIFVVFHDRTLVVDNDRELFPKLIGSLDLGKWVNKDWVTFDLLFVSIQVPKYRVSVCAERIYVHAVPVRLRGLELVLDLTFNDRFRISHSPLS